MAEANDKKLRILHISDIHYSSKNKDVFDSMVKTPFLKFIKEKNSEKQIDIICLTGDLINQGTGGFTSTEEALSNFDNNFLSPLLDSLNIDKQSIFICPGNHDVNRELDKDTEIKIKNQLSSNIEINKTISEQRSIEEHEGINRVLPFKKYEANFYKDNTDSTISFFDSYHSRIINNVKLGILSVNSAWRCFDNDSKIILGINQIQNNYPKIQDNDFNILLSHYKIDKCSDIDTMTENIITNFNLCCYGHTHSSGSATIIDSRNRKTVISVSKGLIPSNWTEINQNYENGFSLIDIDLTTDEISVTVQPYTYSGPEKNCFVLDTHSLGKDESAQFSLSKRIIHTEEIFSETIRKEYSDYLFQFINIQFDDYINRTVSDTQNPDNKLSLFEELNKYRKVVLLANAGMGKTFEAIKLSQMILTDKNFDNYIPIFLRANLYKTSFDNLEEGIKEQLRPFTKTDTDKYYEDNINDNIMLIIDGLDEVTDKSKYRSLINEINRFAALYPKMFSFITCRTNQFHNDLSNYKDFTLNPLTDWEIRGYLQKHKINENKFSTSYFELFKNPFLLSLATNVYSQQEAFSKFYNKSKFLEQCCLFLAGKRDEEKELDMPNINSFKLFCEIGKIAFENFDKNSYTQVEFDELFSTLFSASEVFSKFRNEIFVAGQNFEFKHRLFKEYLIAFYLNKVYPFCDDNFDFYKRLINQEAYFEILCFVSGMLTDIETQNNFFDFLLENNFKLFLYCITSKNDLSEQLQALTIDDYSDLYINTFYKTYIKTIDLYFKDIKNQFNPKLGVNVNTDICCYGSFSDNKKSFHYWFDRIESPEKKVIIVPQEQFQNYFNKFHNNCKIDKRNCISSYINLEATRLEGDSARYLAINEIYKNLTRILDNHLLAESEYVIAEFINILINNLPEECHCSNMEDFCKYIDEKQIPLPLEFNKKIEILKNLKFDLNTFPLLKKTNYVNIHHIIDFYSKDDLNNYISNFFYYSELAFKKMVEQNFNNIKQYFKTYLDIPYQIVYQYQGAKDNNPTEWIIYYPVASKTIVFPNNREDEIDFNTLDNERTIYNSKFNRCLLSNYTCRSFIGNFISDSITELPFTKFVYDLIKQEIDGLFNDFKSF